MLLECFTVLHSSWQLSHVPRFWITCCSCFHFSIAVFLPWLCEGACAAVNLQCLSPLGRRLSPPIHPGTELPGHQTAWIQCLKDAVECSECDSALFIFSNRFRGFPPPPDLPQNLLFLDIYMISTLIWWVMIPLGARFNHFSSVVIYVDIHFLGDFKCFSCFLRLLGMNHTYLLRLASGKSSWFAFFSPLLLLPPDCFLWAQGPSQPFGPCEGRFSAQKQWCDHCSYTNVHKAAALSHA